MHWHWRNALRRNGEELERWQAFKDYQRKYSNEGRLKTDLDLDTSDQTLADLLTRLSDWQEFEEFQQSLVDRANCLKEDSRQEFEDLRANVPRTGRFPRTLDDRRRLYYCLLKLGRSQSTVDSAEKPLSWIKQQYPMMLSEAIDTLDSSLHPSLVTKLAKQANAIHQRLENLGGIPSRYLLLPDSSLGCRELLSHWASESQYFKEELIDWRLFWAWRKKFRNADLSNMGQERVFNGNKLHYRHYDDHVDFRSWDLEKAHTWVSMWQLEIKQHGGATPLINRTDDYYICGDSKHSLPHLHSARAAITRAETRLRQAFAARAVFLKTKGMSDTNCKSNRGQVSQQIPLSPPPTARVSPGTELYHRTIKACGASTLPVPEILRRRKRSAEEMLGSSEYNGETSAMNKRRCPPIRVQVLCHHRPPSQRLQCSNHLRKQWRHGKTRRCGIMMLA